MECEQIFFNQPLVVAVAGQSGSDDIRYVGLGRTDADRWLTVVFTFRQRLIRPISVRPMSKKEKVIYASVD